MSARLMEETQSLDDAIVEVDQLRFAEAVYVDLRSHESLSFKECRAAQLIAWTGTARGAGRLVRNRCGFDYVRRVNAGQRATCGRVAPRHDAGAPSTAIDYPMRRIAKAMPGRASVHSRWP